MSGRHIVMSMPERHDDDLLTTAQVAIEWHVSPRTVQRYVASGQVKATRLPSGVARIRRRDADAALSIAAA